MRLDGFGILVKDMGAMIRFYRDVLGFEIKEAEDTANVFLEKDGTLFLLFGRKDFEQMTSHKYGYAEGENGHFEIALSVENYAEVDKAFAEVVAKGAKPILEPTTEPWGSALAMWRTRKGIWWKSVPSSLKTCSFPVFRARRPVPDLSLEKALYPIY